MGQRCEFIFVNSRTSHMVLTFAEGCLVFYPRGCKQFAAEPHASCKPALSVRNRVAHLIVLLLRSFLQPSNAESKHYRSVKNRRPQPSIIFGANTVAARPPAAKQVRRLPGKPQPYASAASDYGGPGGRGASDYGGPTGQRERERERERERPGVVAVPARRWELLLDQSRQLCQGQ